MYRKKEIIIIIVIFVLSILCYYTLSSISDKKYTKTNNFVKVKVEGEVKKEITLTIPKGYTYGYVINKSQIYFNEYSYYECDLYEEIISDSVITILSLDINNDSYTLSDVKVSISFSSFDELITVYGIGEKRANKIIDYRKNKKILSYEELQQILGVSNEVMVKIKSQTIL